MKRIGSGWQYVVYDLGNGRVLKKPRSSFSQFWRILSEFSNPFTKVSESARKRVDSWRGVQALLGEGFGRLTGNPEFYADGSFSQDKVTPLGVYSRHLSEWEAGEMLKKYPLLILEQWKRGFSETVFNFNINSGVDSSGRLVQLDLGQLAFDKEEIAGVIKERRWLKANNYVWMRDASLKAFYAKVMNESLTLENLDKYWKDSHS